MTLQVFKHQIFKGHSPCEIYKSNKSARAHAYQKLSFRTDLPGCCSRKASCVASQKETLCRNVYLLQTENQYRYSETRCSSIHAFLNFYVMCKRGLQNRLRFVMNMGKLKNIERTAGTICNYERRFFILGFFFSFLI